MSHFITKCDCGTVISQCRCFSKEKIESVVAKGCEKCKSTVSASAKQQDLQKALEEYFAKEAAQKGKGPFHECGKCFHWKDCTCPQEKEAGKPKQLAKAIKDVQDGDTADQTAVALKKLHKGEQDQLAVEIKKKHVNH